LGKKRGATDAHPLKADVNKTGEGGNQDIVSYLFSGVHTPLNLIRAQPKKKEKKVRQEIENSSGDLTLSRCCCSIRTHTTFYFLFQTTQRNVPRHHKNISQLSLSPEPTTTTTTTTTSNSM
jgi:hypothetical protein